MCGLFGYIGKDNKRFSWDKFNVLGLFNDSRGGDSCGRYLLGKVLYGVEKKKLYRDLVLSYKNDSVFKENNVILGHCRKATVGAHTEANAQPIVLVNESLTEEQLKQENVLLEDFVMIHNGTLQNHEELAEKYGIKEVKGETDSKILAKLIKKEGFKILTEYIGAAAIVIYDIREKISRGVDVVYIFRGKSKAYNTSTTSDEERPLFLYNIDEDYWYFSSLEESLSFIDNSKDDQERIAPVEPNTLYKFENGKLVSKTVYDRSECLQKKPYVSTYTGHNHNAYGYDYYSYGSYGDDYEDDVAYQRYWERESERYKEGNKFNTKKEDKKIPVLIVPSKTKFDSEIDKESIEGYYGSENILFARGRYYHKKQLLNGVYNCSPLGYITTSKYTSDYKVYFIDGILIQPHCYKMAKQIYTLAGKVDYITPFIAENYLYLGENAFTRYDFKVKGNLFATGYFSPLFSLRSYLIVKGISEFYKTFNTKTDFNDIGKRVGMSHYYSNFKSDRTNVLSPEWLRTDFTQLSECIKYYFGDLGWEEFKEDVRNNYEDLLLALKSESFAQVELCKQQFLMFVQECQDITGLSELIKEANEIIEDLTKTLKTLD